MSDQPRLALFEELERLLRDIEPEDYVLPIITGIPNEAKELGVATDKMKRLWTLWSRLQQERSLGNIELLKRAVHTAISYEIGAHFNCWRARIGINNVWQVYAVPSN